MIILVEIIPHNGGKLFLFPKLYFLALGKNGPTMWRIWEVGPPQDAWRRIEVGCNGIWAHVAVFQHLVTYLQHEGLAAEILVQVFPQKASVFTDGLVD